MVVTNLFQKIMKMLQVELNKGGNYIPQNINVETTKIKKNLFLMSSLKNEMKVLSPGYTCIVIKVKSLVKTINAKN